MCVYIVWPSDRQRLTISSGVFALSLLFQLFSLSLSLSFLLVFLFVLFAIRRLRADFRVIFFQSCQVFSRFGELAFFHAFSDVPVDKRSLAIHQVKLVVESGEDFGDGGRVGDHADGSHDLGEITTWNNSWWLIVDSALETGWAPIDELNGSLGLDGGDGGVDILWDDISSVHEAASHVFSVSWIALGHHGGWLEGRVGDLGDGELLVISFLGRDDWGIR